MTQAIPARSPSALGTGIDLHYQVAMPHPTSHLFEVTLTVQHWRSPVLNLRMPVWTPGSYLVREYSRQVQDFHAQAEDALAWKKLSKNHWQVDTYDVSDLTIRYRVYANELSVRTNHLDKTHGYFNGAALFLYVPELIASSMQVTIAPPPGWHVTTTLPPVAERENTFLAADFDTLVDSPFEIGTHQLHDFTVLDKPHQLAIWGQGNVDPARLIADIQTIVEVEADLFGGLPYDRYLFLLHLAGQGYGGLEHKNSCSLIYSRLAFQSPDKYQRFMQLVAHEFFHLWNVKRIRPKALETFDYEAENYTPSLWFSEGTTSYYDLVIPFRAGIYKPKTFLQELSKEITRYLQTPGRRVQPLSESSFDAWIKLYRRDANSDNSQISYYLKGEMVSLLLDLLIRARHANQRSLDDVMRRMWQDFGKTETGFTPEELETAIASVADADLSGFFQVCLHSTEELPFDHFLEPFGLQLHTEFAHHPVPHLGMTVVADQGHATVKFVEYGAPAQQAGIDAGDQLLAINGLRITADHLAERLREFAVGDRIQLTLFHHDELYSCHVELAEPRPNHYQVMAVDDPTPAQQQNFERWLGVPLESVFGE